MAKQITVRLPDEQVDFLDREVAAGHVSSRAAGVARALRREQRRARAEQDLSTLLAAGEDPDRAGVVDWAADHQAFPDER
jgi:Arc/MetJ-type ribon-helix-helix transcriptional regulator